LVDTDKIDWEADGTILLPTISNCLEFADKAYAEDGLERFKSDQWVPGMPTSIFEVYLDYILNKTKILPIISDPTDVDTDGDGYTDDVDPRPLISDLRRYSIERIGNYVPVEYDGPETDIYAKKIYYGGNQSWFYDEKINSSIKDLNIQEGGCGLISAADLIIYLTLYHSDIPASDIFKLVTSSEYEGKYISYEDYDVFIRILNDLLPPWNVNEIIYLPFTGLNQTLGYPAGRLKDLLEEYFTIIGVEANVNSQEIYNIAKKERMDKDELLQGIISQLERDIPVPLVAGLRGGAPMLTLDIDTGELEISDDKFQVHWVNVLAVTIDKITSKATLEVASWGKTYFIDLDDYYSRTWLFDGVIWIE
jgi:hypothetical protein